MQFQSEKVSMVDKIRKYWNENIHDIEITKYPAGTRKFFDELEFYRFKKNEYLLRIVNFNTYKGKRLLEIGCGVGIDLVHFAKGGAIVTGIDLADRAIELAKKSFELHGVEGEFQVMDGEDMSFEDDSFDVVYAHGVLAYTGNAQNMIREIHRVLKPGGAARLMMYHRNSWLFFLAKLFGVRLERDDAPVFNTYTINEFRLMLSCFSKVEIIVDRFPVPNRIQKGIKTSLYNSLFVPFFNMIPKSIVRHTGAHLIAKAVK